MSAKDPVRLKTGSGSKNKKAPIICRKSKLWMICSCPSASKGKSAPVTLAKVFSNACAHWSQPSQKAF